MVKTTNIDMSKTLKRKRVDESNALSKKKKKKISRVARSGPTVRGDALKWKEVKLPDRLEDAEGFYGLEEIDDVEILKDSDGQISFRPKRLTDVIVGPGEAAGEDWTGFDDTANGNDIAAPESVADEPAHTTQLLTGPSGTPYDRQQKQKQTENKKKDQSATKTPTLKSKPIAQQPPDDVEDEVNFEALDELEERTQADVTAWKELGLSPAILSAISSLGFSDPTPIQAAAIPPIQDGRDVIGKAVTGSGKTLAFGIPIIESWLELQNGQLESTPSSTTTTPIAFILAPTRELAHQLSQHLLALAKGLDISPRIATVTGGLALVKQQRQLEHADIIVGTPGRLWGVNNSSHGVIDRLKQIQYLVIDEADRLLSEGHFKEVEEILDVLDREVIDEDGTQERGKEEEKEEEEDEKQDTSSAAGPRQQQRQRQTLVFSATFHKGLQQRLASKQKRWQQNDSDLLLSSSQSVEYLLKKLRFQPGTKPTFVDANPASSMAESLSESMVECGAMQKDLYLYSLLLLQQHQGARSLRNGDLSTAESSKIARTLVFANSISTVKRLVPFLTSLCIPKTTVLPLHSSMPQKARLRSLERFTQPTNAANTTAILIATDVAARGLDIKGVDTVVHYHVPRTAEMYVHRSGRTARASSSGQSILICSPDETAGVIRLISKIHVDRYQQQGQQPKPSARRRPKIDPFPLPPSLPSQLSTRVSLAQKISTTTLSTSQTKSEESWLRTAAQELGADYSSEEFEANAKRNRRGRGSGREQRKKDAVQTSADGTVGLWKAELRDDLKTRRVDFGDGIGVDGKGGGRRGLLYLAGGAVDMERLLREEGI